MTKAAEGPVEWSPGNQILFTEGKAWGLTPNLRTAVLGPEEKVKMLMKKGRGRCNRLIQGVILDEKRVTTREKQESPSRTRPRRTVLANQPFWGVKR